MRGFGGGVGHEHAAHGEDRDGDGDRHVDRPPGGRGGGRLRDRVGLAERAEQLPEVVGRLAAAGLDRGEDLLHAVLPADRRPRPVRGSRHLGEGCRHPGVQHPGQAEALGDHPPPGLLLALPGQGPAPLPCPRGQPGPVGHTQADEPRRHHGGHVGEPQDGVEVGRPDGDRAAAASPVGTMAARPARGVAKDPSA